MDFIAIIIVMVVLIGYLCLIITKMSQQVGEQIRKDVDRLVNIYDDLLEEKSQELIKLQQKIEELENIEIPEYYMPDDTYDVDTNGVFLIQGGHYVDKSFFKKYNSVKHQFHDIAYEAMCQTVNVLVKTRRDINVHEFKELLNTFDFNLQYEMETLDSRSQVEIMDLIYVHSMGKRRIVERYIEEYGDFYLREFIDYLRNYIFYHDSIVTVYSHTGEPCMENVPKNVVFKQDLAIGEGYIVKFRGQCYDFSLKDE